MDNKRSTKNQPFCWQEKKILRLLRCQYEGKEHDKLRNLYLTLTEIYSDFNGRDIKYYTQTIIKYSSLSKEWIPKGLKIFENLKVIQLVEERNKGKFKGKRLVFTPENIEEMEKFINEEKINDENTIPDKTVTEFLEPSEDNLYLEDNKRIKDINNTHTEEKGKEVIEKKEKNINNILPEKQEKKGVEKKEKSINDAHTRKQEEEFEKDKLSDAPMEIQDILKKYRDLELPDFKYPPENYIILGVYRELGIAKLFEALTLMSQSKFVKNNMSINAIFKIENLKKALNGNFKDKANRTKNIYENKKEFERPTYENTTGNFIKDILKEIKGEK